jgi:ADP-heptose:LPS heptosyltransferase
VARNVPVVAIFCATTPSLGYGPYGDRAVVVEKKDLFCRPCRRHGSPTCPRGTEDCMRQVTVADVLAGVDTLVANTGTKATFVSLPVHG